MLASEKHTNGNQLPAVIVCDLVLNDGESIEQSLANVSKLGELSVVPVFISSDHSVSEAPASVAGVLQKRPCSLVELHGLIFSAGGVVRDRRKSSDRRTGS